MIYSDYAKHLMDEANREIPTIDYLDFGDFDIIEQSFRVKEYKLVIRDTIDINLAKCVEAQNYYNEHAEYKKGQNTSFCPIYCMIYPYMDQDYAYYYGKTNSTQPRFKNHKKLDDFIGETRIQDKKLHLVQVFVTFDCNSETQGYRKFRDIPLEWLEFKVDKNDCERKKLLYALRKKKSPTKWISLLPEIDKIILFIENFLINCKTPGNTRIEIPRSLYKIYTPEIKIYKNDGSDYICNFSPREYGGFNNDYIQTDMDNNIHDSITNEKEYRRGEQCYTYEYWLNKFKGDGDKDELWLE